MKRKKKPIKTESQFSITTHNYIKSYNKEEYLFLWGINPFELISWKRQRLWIRKWSRRLGEEIGEESWSRRKRRRGTPPRRQSSAPFLFLWILDLLPMVCSKYLRLRIEREEKRVGLKKGVDKELLCFYWHWQLFGNIS